jgi:hypothetical protein
MAEATAMRNNALPYPVYGLPFVVTFPLLDADGDPISPSSPDSEISKNGDTFADCTNEATEIATSSGSCYLSLTGTELTTDVATVQVKSTGAKTTVLTLYPRKLVSIRAGTSASGGVSTSTIVLDGSASAVDDFYNGMIVSAVIDSVTEVRMITDYTGSNQTATVVPDWNTAPDNNDTFTIYRPDGVQVQQANASHWNSLATVALPLTPTTAGRTLDVSAGGEAGVDWANVGSPTTSLALTGTTIATTQKVDVETIKTNPVVNGGTITFPTTATLASTTNITAGTITTATNVTTVNGLAANVITAAATAADFSTEVNAGVLAVLGALNDAASDGAVTTTDTMVAYLKQIINTLEGAPGLPTWPTAAAPANGVSIAEALRYVYDQIGLAGAALTEAGGDGDHLTAINLPNQTMDIVGNITGNLSGSVGSVTGAVGSVTGNVGGNVTGSVGSLGATAKSDVNAEVLDVISTDTFGEPTGVPGATLTLREKIGWLFMALRNKLEITSTKKTFYDDGGAAEWEKDLADDGTTYSESEGNAI